MMQARRRSSLGGLGEEDLQGIQQFLCQETSSAALTYRQMQRCARSRRICCLSPPAATRCGTEAGFCAMMCFPQIRAPGKTHCLGPQLRNGQVATYNRRRFARDIGAYRYLSAREASGVQIIRQLTGREAVQITDPHSSSRPSVGGSCTGTGSRQPMPGHISSATFSMSPMRSRCAAWRPGPPRPHRPGLCQPLCVP